MVGKKGKSGGTREGAGHPPRVFQLRLGDALAISDGGLLEIGRVVEISRTKLTIRLNNRKLEVIR